MKTWGWAGRMCRREHTATVVYVPRVAEVKAVADHTANTLDRLQQPKSRLWLCHVMPCHHSSVGYRHTCGVMSGLVQAEDPDERVQAQKASGFSHMLPKSFQGKPPLMLHKLQMLLKTLKMKLSCTYFCFHVVACVWWVISSSWQRRVPVTPGGWWSNGSQGSSHPLVPLAATTAVRAQSDSYGKASCGRRNCRKQPWIPGVLKKK